jgi:hypothetical protein
VAAPPEPPAEAREELGTAYQMLAAMGVEGFAERARQELIKSRRELQAALAQSQEEDQPA